MSIFSRFFAKLGPPKRGTQEFILDLNSPVAGMKRVYTLTEDLKSDPKQVELTRGQGPIQFSLANALQPGVFHVQSMESLRTTGLCLFMTLPGPSRPMQAFTNMMECARILAQEFGASLLDTQRSVFSRQTENHYRDKIRTFELKHRSGPYGRY